MSGDELAQAIAGQVGDTRLRLAASGVAGDWFYDELREAWRESQAEARRAYADWRDGDIPHGYLLYRAAQDRADAAHDALARRMASHHSREHEAPNGGIPGWLE